MNTRGIVISMLAAAAAVVVTAVGAATAQTAAPKTAWGEPDLSGVWKSPAPVGARGNKDTYNLAQLDRLYKPDARRAVSPQDDPSLRCRPSPFPRAAILGGSIQITQAPGMAYVFTEAFPTYRIIPTDGKRRLTADFLIPYFMGNSAAHWEGDTLVVDVISFNGEGWLASRQDKPSASSPGVWPTSDQMKVRERWRRVNGDTLEYQARIEDPGVLTGPWETAKITLKRQNIDRIEEALCIEKAGAATYLERSGFTN